MGMIDRRALDTGTVLRSIVLVKEEIMVKEGSQRGVSEDNQSKIVYEVVPSAHLLAFSIIAFEISMSKVFHPHPGDDHPYPRHDTRQDQQCRVITHDGQGRIILEFRGRVGGLANIPGPRPHAKAGAHAHDKDQPRDDENNITPKGRLRIIPSVVDRRRASGRLWRRGER